MTFRTTLPPPPRQPSIRGLVLDMKREGINQSYVGVGLLLLLVALAVSGGLRIIGLALGLGQGLPPVTKALADLAWRVVSNPYPKECDRNASRDAGMGSSYRR